MTNELKKCVDCKYFSNGLCRRNQPEVFDIGIAQLLGYSSCESARNTFCGISAVYFEPSEPSIEQLESMFDNK